MASPSGSASATKNGGASGYQGRYSGLEDFADKALEHANSQGPEALAPVPDGSTDLATSAKDKELTAAEDANGPDQNGAMVTNDSGELEPRLQANQVRIKASEIPKNFVFAEPGYDVLMKHASILTKHYAGRDREDLMAFQHKNPGFNFFKLENRGVAAIQLVDRFGKEHVFGGNLKNSDAEGAIKPYVKMSFTTSTQVPAVVFTILQENKPEVNYHIFANAFRREDNTPQVWFCYGGTDKGVETPKGNKELAIYNNNRELFMLSGALYPDGTDETPRGAPPRRPVFDGISMKELGRIASQMPQSEGEIVALTEQELLIGLLNEAVAFRAFRYWPTGGDSAVRNLTDWMGMAFWMSATYGNNWFYRSQETASDPSIHSPDFDLKKLQKARWLAKDFTIEMRDGKAVGPPVPNRVANFTNRDDSLVFPDKEDMAFQFRLAIERDRAHQTYILKASFQQDDFKITAEFKPFPNKDGWYMLGLQTHDNSLLAKDRSLKPRVDCRIKIEVIDDVSLVPTGDSDGDVDMDTGNALRKIKVFDGILCEDIMKMGSEVCCIVKGSQALDMAKGNKRMVKCELRDDPTPANRLLATMQQLQIGIPLDDQNRPVRGGVDIPAIVLRAPPTIQNTDICAQEFKAMRESFQTELDAIFKRFRMNVNQRKAIMNSLLSDIAFTVIQGPPGTGKTATLIATLYAHIRLGKKLKKERRRRALLCAPSNIAADNALDTLIEHVPAGLEIVRYRGSYLHEPSAASEDTAMEDAGEEGESADDEVAKAQEALWEQADEIAPFGDDPHQDYSFYKKRHAAICRWAANTEHEMHDDALAYLDVRHKVKNPSGIPPKEKQENKMALEALTEKISRYYLNNEVDVVVSTNSTSAHGLLRTCFNPTVLIGDEYAVCTLADAATGMGAFIHSLETIVIGGDNEQQLPMVNSKGTNEFASLLELSLFALIYKRKTMQDAVVQLTVQHRMHPDLSQDVSDVFYNGQLEDAPSVITRDNPKWHTMDDFLRSGLGPAWNGRRRIGLDVSGQGVQALPYNDSTSYYNAAEANTIVKYIEAAIAHPVPATGQQIQASDFLVISTYTGQCQLIRSLLIQNGVGSKGDRVRIASVRAIQGEQAPFVIISMTANSPGQPLKLGLVSDKHGLCVAMSRPEEMLLVVGNFKAWVQNLVNGAGVLHNKGGKMVKFGQLLGTFFERKDLVSIGDWTKFMTGQAITQAEFPTLIKEKKDKGKGKAQGGPSGFPSGPPPRSDQYSIYDKREQDEKKKKARRPNKNKPAGKTGQPPPPPPPPGGAGAIAGAS